MRKSGIPALCNLLGEKLEASGEFPCESSSNAALCHYQVLPISSGLPDCPDSRDSARATRLQETPAPATTSTLLYTPSLKSFATSSISTLICPAEADRARARGRRRRDDETLEVRSLGARPDDDRVSCFATCRSSKEDDSSRAEGRFTLIMIC